VIATRSYVRGYEKEHRVVLPRPGSEMDMGKTLTHKKLAFQNHKKKRSTTKNARLINYSPESEAKSREYLSDV
jgi:Protein of unknown function (DUF1670)